MLTLKRVLMCPPDYFNVVDQKNPYMSANATVNHAKARRQWKVLRTALEQCGCEVETIDPVKGLEDMVFAANQIFVGSPVANKDGYGKFAVPSRMVYQSRQREVPFYEDWFRSRDYQIIDLDFGDDFLEGHGDLLWHPGGSRVYAGYGFRSTLGGVEKFAAAMAKMGIEVVPLQLIDPYCYHLDTCFCPLNDGAVLIYPGAYSAEALESIHNLWPRVHLLTADEARAFMGNGIVCNGSYITPRFTRPLETILRQEGLTALIVDTSEFEKAGGSVFCMKMFLP
jgi:N-dimethylarginine dimethylaminohydrolase